MANVANGAIGIALVGAFLWEVLRITFMVLANLIEKAWIERVRRQAREEGREEGREQGRKEEREAWEAWLRRLEEAEASNQPFDEPPPSRSKSANGSS